ncbi:MAG: hypothetical protein IJX16_00270 [Clostridia bacterium]|nr:hypothetical protein [Clostridia bacterium]
MKANYDIVINIKLTHEIDTLENLKGDREMAEDIAHMICDEAVNANGVATYDILASCVTISPVYCKQVDKCPEHKKICCNICRRSKDKTCTHICEELPVDCGNSRYNLPL